MAHSDVSPAAHMDAIYRYQRHIYDASRKYYLLGRDRLLDELAPPGGGTVLEVACGTARNLVGAARRYPHARLYGFDVSTAMLDTARNTVVRNRLHDRVTLRLGDATDFTPEHLFKIPAFDRVFVSYALSMIPPWRLALQRALGALAPGGELHIVDFGRQEGLPRWFRSGLRAWLARFSVEPRAELAAALDAIALLPGFRVRRETLYRGYAVYAVVTREQTR